MIRIAITGPESSGKTTISKQLCELLGGCLSPEYARYYLTEKAEKYFFEDLDAIAEGQIALWAKASGGLHICDTEFTVLKIWSEIKFKKISAVVYDYYLQQKFDHYFLCKPDMPWEPDPLREDEDSRDVLFDKYREDLLKMKRPFTILSGTKEQRIVECEKIIMPILAENL